MVLFTITNPSHTLSALIIYNLESFGNRRTAGFMTPNAKQMRFTLIEDERKQSLREKRWCLLFKLIYTYSSILERNNRRAVKPAPSSLTPRFYSCADYKCCSFPSIRMHVEYGCLGFFFGFFCSLSLSVSPSGAAGVYSRPLNPSLSPAGAHNITSLCKCRRRGTSVPPAEKHKKRSSYCAW